MFIVDVRPLIDKWNYLKKHLSLESILIIVASLKKGIRG